MPRRKERSTVVTLRVSSRLKRSIEQVARRRRRSKSELLREILEQGLRGHQDSDDPAHEARRQSLLVSGRKSEKDALAFIQRASDARGWR